MLDDRLDHQDRFGRSSSDGVRLEARRLLESAGKISAIKYVREKKGYGLAQGKAYVDALGAGRNPDEAAQSAPAQSGGYFPLLVFVLLAGAFIWWLARISFP